MSDTTFMFLDPARIEVDREQRQRQMNFNIEDLIPSIRARGILNPILVDAHYKLIAGERRLATALFLKMAEVPIRFYENLSPIELQIVELEENLKRKDLTWQDQAKAIRRIHLLYVADEGDEWLVERTAASIGLSEHHVYRMIDLGEAIEEGDQSILKADTIAAATTILTRRRARQRDAAMNAIMEIDLTPKESDAASEMSDEAAEDNALVEELFDENTPPERVQEIEQLIATTGRKKTEPAPAEPPFAIMNSDFSEWAANYKGKKFNFLHCDLPYGVVLHGQANQAAFEGGGYDSNPDIYWKLCNDIVNHWDNFMYPSAHVVFWISMKFYTETVQFFEHAVFQRKLPDDLKINPTPLIWHKTDGKGIIPDALRGPRNIYEAALIMSTGDRHIVKPVANVYGAPTAKAEAIHTNEKPEPMLRHFLSMFVDQHSRVLDPTCGSGAAIRTAESLGAEAGLGLEINPEFAARAQARLVQARGLLNLSKIVSEAEASPLDTPEGAD